MQRKHLHLGAILLIALFFSFSFQDNDPIKKLSDLSVKSVNKVVVVQFNKTYFGTNETDASGNYWLDRTAIPVGTDYGSGAAYSRNDTGWVYVMGGNFATSLVYRYNMRTDSWSSMANLPLGKDRMGSAVLKDSIYSIGGSTVDPDYTTDFYKYDINSNTWTSRTPLPNPMGWCKGLGYQDSLIYVAGGFDGSATLAQVLLYNSKNNTWRIATPMPGIRFGGGFAVSGDTLVYVSGVDGADYTNTVFVGVISQTDRSVINWTSGTPLPVPLSTGQYRFDAHNWGNKGIIITGGSSDAFDVSDACMSYSPGANAWTILPNKPTAWTAGQSGVAFSNGALRLVCASGNNGSAIITTTEMYSDTLVTVGISDPFVNNVIPNGYELEQNYPNPFNPSTTISFSLPEKSSVVLKIYNQLGKEIMTLVNDTRTSGNYRINFDASGLSSGIYFYKLETADFTHVKTMVLLK
ncbi:MAG: kelch repeat-containing protein [Ignavibacteria bacterium]